MVTPLSLPKIRMRYVGCMSPYVIFQLPNGEVAKATPGSILGRLSSASVRIDDPRVSEAHALVSLRGSELKLLTLRGSIRVDGRRDADVHLDARLTQPGDARASDVGVRILDGDDDPGDARGDQRPGARAGPALVVARLQRGVDGRADRVLGRLEGLDLGVVSAGRLGGPPRDAADGLDQCDTDPRSR